MSKEKVQMGKVKGLGKSMDGMAEDIDLLSSEISDMRKELDGIKDAMKKFHPNPSDAK